MMNQPLCQLESILFKALNQVAEPLIRAGFGNPVCWPTGAIVLETTGRNTGRTYNVPLVATRIGRLLLVSTVRRRSQWLKNLAIHPRARYWLGGRLYEASAFVMAPGLAEPSLEGMPLLVSYLASILIPQSQLLGIGFAILAPRLSQRKVV
ncbi:MAG TPA: nitroreductase/quinone reductase family protein [Blastocatellia bacterium]|nr:nitroreductase/quinone reductase family protein [Blastocatellia bacterium]